MTEIEKRIEEIRRLATSDHALAKVHPSWLMVLIHEIDRLKGR